MTDLRDLDLLLVDCQTTGASPAHGHLLELGWTRYRADDPIPSRIRAKLVALPDDQRLPGRVADLTGITEEMLADADPLEPIWRTFCEAVDSADRVAAHYAQFERRFLEDTAERIGAAGSPFTILCTHAVAQRLYPGLPRRGLRALAGFVGHPVEESNRAGPHVRATAAIWRHLVGQLRERAGVTTLDGLRKWLETPADPADEPTYAIDRNRRLALPDRPGLYGLVGADDEVLYVGKATSLRSRVNQYFQTRKGLAEHKLELVSQVHDVEVRPTATPLEAALLETDRIKTIDPPYNRALVDDGADPARLDPARYGAGGAPASRSVTVRDARTIAAFQRLENRESREGHPSFAPETLYEFGMAFWPPPDRDDDAELSPVDRLASLIRRGAAAIRARPIPARRGRRTRPIARLGARQPTGETRSLARAATTVAIRRRVPRMPRPATPVRSFPVSD
ncbi:MAG: exonuclease domain-containing protein [Bradymonadaceae bacterium]